MNFGKSVVYFSPGRYRLMETKGDRVDRSFSYKIMTPREAWRQVCAELHKINPGV